MSSRTGGGTGPNSEENCAEKPLPRTEPSEVNWTYMLPVVERNVDVVSALPDSVAMTLDCRVAPSRSTTRSKPASVDREEKVRTTRPPAAACKIHEQSALSRYGPMTTEPEEYNR